MKINKPSPILLKFLPHGINSEIFKPLDKNDPELLKFKKKLLGEKEYDFILFFNSRNIRRKQIPDSILSYKYFIDKLTEEQAKKCLFILHTERVSEHGTDLNAVSDLLLNNPKYNIMFDEHVYDVYNLNMLYNITNLQILISSNEGWGLSITEAILVGNPIVANVTGGMQDQMRFEDSNGNWINFDNEILSNHTGAYKNHGEWAFPVFPSNLSIQGSPITPYIFDDRCNPKDVAEQIYKAYNLGSEKLKELGLKGREWFLSEEAGIETKKQAKRIIDAFDELFKTWVPREKLNLIDVNNYPIKSSPNNFVY